MQQVSNKPITTTVPSHRENDTLYLIPREGRIVKRTWDELTTTERDSLQQAERRAAYVAQFSIYG